MAKKILILTPFFPPNIGGAETFTEGLCDSAKKWFEVSVLTFQPFKKKAQRYEEYYYKRGHLKIHRMSWVMRHGRVWQGFGIMNLIYVFPKMFVKALFLCRKNRFDIIHAQGLISGLVGVFLKKIFGCKLFITLLALYDVNERSQVFFKVVGFILDRCDKVFVEGDHGEWDIQYFYDKEKTIQFNHWVDHDIFKPPKNRLNDKVRVLFIGRPLPEKGRYIIEGAERILNNPKKYEFTYVEKVAFKDLPKIYQDHHILCVPSLYSEGHSRVVAEGLACGCAVTTSDKGSLPEQIARKGIAVEPTAENFALIIKSIADKKIRIQHQIEDTSKNSEVFLNEYTNA
jgi:glycosyltransferase involved in cell wall biosynthesis